MRAPRGTFFTWHSGLLRSFRRSAPIALVLAACVSAPRAAGADVVVGCAAGSVLSPSAEPVGSYAPAMIYDSSRDRLVVYGLSHADGGTATDRVMAMGLDGSAAWTDITPPVGGPGARYEQSAVYDATRDRLLLIGQGPTVTEVWALSLATGAWSQVLPAGTPPSRRGGQTVILDSGRDRLVLFGGLDDNGMALADAWTLNLAGSPAWAALSPGGTPPPGRFGATAIYDSPRNRMIVFGGLFANNYSTNEVWSLSMSGTVLWSKLNPTGTPPAERYAHTAIFDAPRNRMIVAGGAVAAPVGFSGPLNDVWSLSLSGGLSWTRLNPSGATFPAESQHRGVYDSVRQRLLCFGGYGATYAELWALPMTGTLAWSEAVITGQPPLIRDRPIVVYDAPRSRAVLFGGRGPSAIAMNDVWAYALGASPGWSRILPTGAGPVRRDACGALDSLGGRLLVFGGNDGQHDQNDVWTLTLAGTPAWTRLNPSGVAPSPRRSATAVVDRGRNRLLVIGGRDSTDAPVDEIWSLSLAGGGAWSQLNWGGEPISDWFEATAVYDALRDRVLVLPGPTNMGNWLYALTFAGGDTLSPLVYANAASSPWAVIDPVHDRLLALDANWRLGSVSLAAVSSWDAIGTTAPVTGELLASAVWDAAAQRVVMFCGTPPPASYPTNVVRTISFPTNLYTLSYRGQPELGGTVTVDSSWSCYVSGTPVTLTAVPTFGFDFTGWTGTITSSANPLSLSMDSNKSLVAIFRRTTDTPAAAQARVTGIGCIAPNPGHLPLRVDFTLARPGPARLAVYDLAGRELRVLASGVLAAGEHERTWDGSGYAGVAAPGVYFLRLGSGNREVTRRIVLLR